MGGCTRAIRIRKNAAALVETLFIRYHGYWRLSGTYAFIQSIIYQHWTSLLKVSVHMSFFYNWIIFKVKIFVFFSLQGWNGADNSETTDAMSCISRQRSQRTESLMWIMTVDEVTAEIDSGIYIPEKGMCYTIFSFKGTLIWLRRMPGLNNSGICSTGGRGRSERKKIYESSAITNGREHRKQNISWPKSENVPCFPQASTC